MLSAQLVPVPQLAPARSLLMRDDAPNDPVGFSLDAEAEAPAVASAWLVSTCVVYPHASISVRYAYPLFVPRTLMRILDVEIAANEAVRFTRLFPRTLATVVQAPFTQAWTSKSVVP